MNKPEFDKIISEIENNPPVIDEKLPRVSLSFDEVSPLSLGADVFIKDQFDEIMKENEENRIIAPVYRIDKNPFKRLYKAIVRKLTAIMYLNAIEEQERHNERTEALIRMLLGKTEQLERENRLLKLRLEDCEKEINRINKENNGEGSEK